MTLRNRQEKIIYCIFTETTTLNNSIPIYDIFFMISVDEDLSLFLYLLFFLQLITREQFEDALKEIQDEGTIVVMGKNTIRIC